MFLHEAVEDTTNIRNEDLVHTDYKNKTKTIIMFPSKARAPRLYGNNDRSAGHSIRSKS